MSVVPINMLVSPPDIHACESYVRCLADALEALNLKFWVCRLAEL